MCSSYLPHGVSQRSSTIEPHQDILWRCCRGVKDGFTRGVSHNHSLYLVFVLLSFFFFVLLVSFFQKKIFLFGLIFLIKNTQKISSYYSFWSVIALLCHAFYQWLVSLKLVLIGKVGSRKNKNIIIRNTA